MVQESQPVVIPKDLPAIDHKVIEGWWVSMLDLMIERDAELLKLADGKKPFIMRNGIAEYMIIHETVNIGNLAITMKGYLNSTIINRTDFFVRRGTRRYKGNQFAVTIEPGSSLESGVRQINIFRLVNPIQHWSEEQGRIEDIVHRSHAEIARYKVHAEAVAEEEAVAVYLKSDEIRFIKSLIVEASERAGNEGDRKMTPRDMAIAQEIINQFSGKVD